MVAQVWAFFNVQRLQVAAREKLAAEQAERASERQVLLQEMKHRLKKGWRAFRRSFNCLPHQMKLCRPMPVACPVV